MLTHPTLPECLKPVVSCNGSTSGGIPPCGSCGPFRIPYPLKTKDQQRNTAVSPFFLLAEVLGLYFISWLRSWVHLDSITVTGDGAPVLNQVDPTSKYMAR